MTDELSPREAAQAIRLRYVNAADKGYTRIKRKGGFIYTDAAKKEIKDVHVLDRIKKLTLPPAWEKVWICSYSNGHLQATGIDAKGRKQYRYHNDWSAVRNEKKFDTIYAFGKKIPLLRKRIQQDLRCKIIEKNKVCAIALSIMDATYIRAGNSFYEKENGSYGLTTLKNRHVKFEGTQAFFKFTGKKGVPQMTTLKNAFLVRLLKQVKELPGQELFQYYNEAGALTKLDSGDVNDYIKSAIGAAFSCKDFRTWAGSVLALQLMVHHAEPAAAACSKQPDASRKTLLQIIDAVAAKLGNTRAVCRKYYIHPVLIQYYEEGRIEELGKPENCSPDKQHRQAEKLFLSFVKALKPKTGRRGKRQLPKK